MLFLRTAVRNFKKNGLFFLINIVGLTFGAAMLLVILNYTFFEYSYDDFHSRNEDIYRVTMDEFEGETLLNEYAITYPAVGPALSERYSEVSDFVRIYTESTYGPVIFVHEGPDGDIKKFTEQKTFYADNSFFDIFNFELIKGDKSTVLEELFSVVITERAAEKFFGREDPVGKVLRMYDRGGIKDLMVKGVAKTPPINSHIQFDFIVSYNSLCSEEWCTTSWDFNDFTTYVRLKPGTNPQAVEQRLDGLLQHYKGPDYQQGELHVKLHLQPMNDIHLYSNRIQELSANGDGNNIRYLLISAVLIVLISWMNYINLSTAISSERAREVGIRKILGSEKRQLILQFLSEAAVINFFATFLAVVTSEIILTVIANQWPDIHIDSFLFDSSFYGLIYKGAIIFIFLVGVVSSGVYPSLVLSSYKPSNALKGGLFSIKGKAFRNILVTLQFTITFIICSLMFAVFQQINFMRTSDLGFDMENVFVIEAPRVVDESKGYSESINAFKNELKASAHIEGMTASTLIPGKAHNWGGEIKRVRHNSSNNLPVYFNGVDYDFIGNYQLNVVSGRAFSKEFGNDQNKSVILNESAVKLLKFENTDQAIGENVVLFGGDTREIVGVVSDFKQESLKNKPVPYALFLFGGQGFYSVKIKGNNINGAILDVKQAWELVFPNNPLNYFFLDDSYNDQYKGEYQFFTVFTISSILLLFIACIGLFGLLAFITNRRLKEISIRKVFGASKLEVWISLYKPFFILLILSMTLAIPITYFLITKWLETYPYSIDVSPMFFIYPFSIVWIISIAVIGLYSRKISRVNPASTINANN